MAEVTPDQTIAQLLKHISALRDENRELWEKIEFARPSVKRDFARCRAFSEGDVTLSYRQWFAELDTLPGRTREKLK